MSLVVLISGKQGSGKTTTAQVLEESLRAEGINVVRLRFASVIYEMHDAVLSILGKYGVKRPELVKDGPLLQLLGTEWGRGTIGPNVWIDCAYGKLRSTETPKDKDTVFIFDDLRFKNERESFPLAWAVRLNADGATRRERCSMWRDNEHHPSEIDFDDSPQYFDRHYDTSVLETKTIVADIKSDIINILISKENA